MTAATAHERDQAGIFLETPEPIREAFLKLLAARCASVASEGLRFPDEITYAELMQLSRNLREAQDEVERVIGEHQGRSYLNGLYRVDGWLVGFRKGRHGKGGLSLVVHPTDETKKGQRS